MFKIIFIVFLTLFSVKSFANINGAGFIGSPTGISFESSKGYGLNQNSYLQSVAGVFGCPQPGEGQTIILHDLDPKTGRITCYLYDETSTDPVQIFKQNISSEEKFLSESSELRKIIDDNSYKNLVIGTRYGVYEFNTNPGYTENYIQ